jgi:hypothetical protein
LGVTHYMHDVHFLHKMFTFDFVVLSRTFLTRWSKIPLLVIAFFEIERFLVEDQFWLKICILCKSSFISVCSYFWDSKILYTDFCMYECALLMILQLFGLHNTCSFLHPYTITNGLFACFFADWVLDSETTMGSTLRTSFSPQGFFRFCFFVKFTLY